MERIFLFEVIFAMRGCDGGPAPAVCAERRNGPTDFAAENSFAHAFNDHGVNPVMRAISDQRVSVNAAPIEYWQKFFRNVPDAEFDSDEMIAARDRCIVQWVYQKAPEGRPWRLSKVDVLRVRDGKIAEKLSYVKG